MSSDTLQAVSKHEKVSIFDSPGDVDLTTQVNFGALGHVMRHHGGGTDKHPTRSFGWRFVGTRTEQDATFRYLVSTLSLPRLLPTIQSVSPRQTGAFPSLVWCPLFSPPRLHPTLGVAKVNGNVPYRDPLSTWRTLDVFP